MEQVSELHVAGWHWLPLDGQSAVTTHWTHMPLASQTVPPPWLQAVPIGRFGYAHIPPPQLAGAHWLPLGGQLPALTHWTQVALASQTVPPFWLHAVPTGRA